MLSVSTFWIRVGTAYGLQILIKLMTGRLHFLCWFYISKKRIYIWPYMFFLFPPRLFSNTNRRLKSEIVRLWFLLPIYEIPLNIFCVIAWQSSTWGQFSFSLILFFLELESTKFFSYCFSMCGTIKIFFKVPLNFINNRKMFACIFHHSFYSCADYYKKSYREKWNKKKWNGDMAIEKEAKSSFY